MNKVILGFDFGMKYIGVAVGQTVTNTSSILKSYLAKKGIPNWNEIDSLIKNWKPSDIIVGLPLNMNGSMQNIALSAQSFAYSLKSRYNIPVHTIDERLTTWEAKSKHPNIAKTHSKSNLLKINSVSASILVEQWLQENAK